MVTGNVQKTTKKGRNAVCSVLPVMSNKKQKNGVSVKEIAAFGRVKIEVVFQSKPSLLRRQHLSKFVRSLSRMIMEHGTVRRKIWSIRNVT